MRGNRNPGKIIQSDEFSLCFPSIAAYLDKDELDVLLEFTAHRDIQEDETLIQYGSLSNSLFMLWYGELTASVIKQSSSFDLGKIGPGKWVGEVSVIDPGPATATVKVTRSGRVLVLTHDAFAELDQSHPAVSIAVLRAISIDLANRMRMSVNCLLEDALERGSELTKSVTQATRNLVGSSG